MPLFNGITNYDVIPLLEKKKTFSLIILPMIKKKFISPLSPCFGKSL